MSPTAASRSEPREPTLRPASGMRDVWRLAWPAVLSFVLNSSYRINDQFWIQGLGAPAQAAIATSTFVLIMNFAIVYLVAGGALALIAHAVGAGDPRERDRVTRHALGASVAVGMLLGLAGWLAAPALVRVLGLEGLAAEQALDYLRTIYLGMVPLALAPVVDSAFIAMGNTLAPMCLQALAVVANFTLNPILIYGGGGPGGFLLEGLGLGGTRFEGLGIEGAALATSGSRGLSVAIGVYLLWRVHRVRLWSPEAPRRALLGHMLRIGAPISLSIAAYAGVYWLLLMFVLKDLGEAVQAGLGIGFNAFEGLSFPFFLGVAVAGSSLVGRNLGARSPEGALEAADNARWLGRGFGLGFALLFWFAGPAVAPLFTSDPAVLAEATLYVRILALSQLFVAEEATCEKILGGAGWTRPIFRISAFGNGLRVPLAYVLAITLGFGAAGVWWAINLTTYLKAWLLAREVRRGDWLAGVHGRAPARNAEDQMSRPAQ